MNLPPHVLARFQAELRRELCRRRCPLPVPLRGAAISPRAVRGRWTLTHWRRGDSTVKDWAWALRQPHGWCIEIPLGAFLIDVDKTGGLELLLPRLPEGFGLVESSQGRFHVWLCGEAPPGQHIGRLDSVELEIHGPGRLATLPPSLHVDTGRPYRWRRPFLGTVPTRPADLGIVVDVPVQDRRRRLPSPGLPSAVPLSELMARFTGQDGRHQGRELAFFCTQHEDRRSRSLMVNDDLGVFFCHGTSCGWRGNRVTLEQLLGMRPPARRIIPALEVQEDKR